MSEATKEALGSESEEEYIGCDLRRRAVGQRARYGRPAYPSYLCSLTSVRL